MMFVELWLNLLGLQHKKPTQPSISYHDCPPELVSSFVPSQVYGEACVWCGGITCTTDSDAKCGPFDYIMLLGVFSVFNTIRLARGEGRNVEEGWIFAAGFFKQQTTKTVRQRTKDLFGPVRLKENSTCGVIRIESIQ